MFNHFVCLNSKWLFLILIVFFSLSNIALAQRKKSAILKYDASFYDGTVLLTDGTELEGKITFNDNEGIVSLVKEDDSKSFTSRDIVKFEFYNQELGRYKTFYSLEYSDPETGVKDYEFFEVLKELDSFAVLAKIDRIKTVVRSGLASPYLSGMPASTTMSRRSNKVIQTQTVFFVSDKGDFEPYLKITEKELQGNLLDWDEKHTHYINGTLFEKYTGRHFKELATYAKEKGLSFKRKTDIILILDKYEEITKE